MSYIICSFRLNFNYFALRKKEGGGGWGTFKEYIFIHDFHLADLMKECIPQMEGRKS